MCTYSTRIALLSDRQTTSCADAAVQNDIRLRRSDLQHIIDSLFCRQGLFLNVIAEDAVSKDVFIVLSGNRLIIDCDFEILYNFVNLIAVLVQFGDRAKQLAGINFSFLLTIADINVIVIYSFQRNIAAGDLDIFAFAIHSSAADGRNRAASAAGLCMYRAALNGNVFAVTLKAAANACCFATGYRRYITIANRNILTRRALTSANACTPVTAVGLDRTTFNNNIAGIFMPCAANACAALTAVGIQLTGAADGQGSIVVGLFHTGVVRAAAQGIRVRACNDQLHIAADRDCRIGSSLDIDIRQCDFCTHGAAFDGNGIVRLAAVRCDRQIAPLLGFIIALLDILFVISPNIDCDAAVFEIHLILSFYLRTVLFVQHAHRAFGGGALLEQGIGACGQSWGGKAEHHARCQRSGSCPPGQNISFHRGSSFAKIITGGGMHYGTLIISHFTGFWKQTCVNRPKSSVKSMICAGSVAVVRPAGTAKPPAGLRLPGAVCCFTAWGTPYSTLRSP